MTNHVVAIVLGCGLVLSPMGLVSAQGQVVGDPAWADASQPVLLAAGPEQRQERRQERGRADERQDRRDCRQEEGRVGQDKRECKQEEVRDGVRGHRGDEKEEVSTEPPQQ